MNNGSERPLLLLFANNVDYTDRRMLPAILFCPVSPFRPKSNSHKAPITSAGLANCAQFTMRRNMLPF